MTSHTEFFTAGYGRWDAKSRWDRLVSALLDARVGLLVDVRHSPCASNRDPGHHYGPRDWHVQADGRGIAAKLREVGIGYLWLVELGNPQKTDPRMAVLREHLADPAGGWPVHRGLELLRGLVADRGVRPCLLCACAEYESCHRKLIAEALRDRLSAGARHRDLSVRT